MKSENEKQKIEIENQKKLIQIKDDKISELQKAL